jgi:ATP-dependent Clp protease ATP-binding subunit ClpA
VEGAPGIDTVHLLKGLMWDKDSRAATIFNLREYFPLHYDLPWKYATKEAVPKHDLPLDLDSRGALRKAASEADALRDYWIDTEHLLLGLLAEKGCTAERYLALAGLTLQRAGQIVIENKLSRPDYGPVPHLWNVQSPWDKFMHRLRMRKYRKAEAEPTPK